MTRLTIAAINETIRPHGLYVDRVGKTKFVFKGTNNVYTLPVTKLSDWSADEWVARASYTAADHALVVAEDLYVVDEAEHLLTVADMRRLTPPPVFNKHKVIDAAGMITRKRAKLGPERKNWFVWVELQDSGVNYARIAPSLKPAFDSMNTGKIRVFIANSELARYARSK